MTTTTHDTTNNYRTSSVLSLNINGMSEDKKRHKLFETLINKNIDISLIQETHSTRNLICKWQKEWLGKSFWNSATIAKSSGVAILIKKDLNVNFSTIRKDKEGRVLSLHFSIEKQNYQIINIYAPARNSEKPNFCKTLKTYIDSKQNLILGGDFNMVEDILLDRKGGNPNKTHTLGLDYLIKIKQANNLTNIWRKENPHKILFTYHNINQQIHSRIDRFYITNNQKITNISIVPNGLSDHEAIQLKIKIKKPHILGIGYWKLSTSILRQTPFQKTFKNFLERMAKRKTQISIYKSMVGIR